MLMRHWTHARCMDERGVALISVMLLVMIASALGAALTISSITETQIARNYQVAAEARWAAEAGISHAVEVTMVELRDWQTNGFASASAAMSDLLLGPDDASGTAATDADNGSLEALGIPRPPATLNLAGLPGISYEARVFDEDDPARGVTLSAADQVRIGENTNVVNDGNTRIVVRAIGYASNGAVGTVEVTIAPLSLPALITNGDLTIFGNAEISGVHSNADLTLSGNAEITEDATASGSYSASGSVSVGGISGGSHSIMTVPSVQAIDHRPKADFILTVGGTLTTPAGVVICDASGDNDACEGIGYGWEYEGANGWKLDGNHASITAGTYYVEGDVDIVGNQGSTLDPLDVTVIAEGSIDVSGNTHLAPHYPGLLFVTDGDLAATGNFYADTVEGQMLVHEQVDLTGNVTLAGQVLVEDAANASSLVTADSITGNTSLDYTGAGAGGSLTFGVTAWRRAR